MTRKLTADEMYIVVKNLVGNIEPYGDSHIDHDRMINMDRLIQLIDMLLNDVQLQCVYLSRPEHSIKEIAENAYSYINQLNETTDDWIKDYEKKKKGVIQYEIDRCACVVFNC